MQPFRTRKVRILNGAHTAMVPFSILYGNDTVKESVDDSFTGPFIRAVVFDEIIPTLEMDRAELNDFAEAVLDRFRNPFIRHQLSSIALNSISKFKVRVLPSLLEYVERENKLPVHLVFAFACLIRFYKGSWQGKDLPVNDDDKIIAEMADLWESGTIEMVTGHVLKKSEYWDGDLTHISGLQEGLALALRQIEEHGIQKGFLNYRDNIKSAIHAK